MSRITPPVPNTTLTPAYSSVSSTAGFQSGDLVYFRDSNFGTIPNNAVTSANFPITANVNQNQIAFNTTVGWANLNLTSRTGSTSCRAPSAALLTNGNIVVVFSENTGGAGAACFRIIDQNGATVVDRTTLGPNSVGLIGVCALTGGGFVVALRNSGSGNFQYGVFSNAGVVVTALATDSNFGTSVSSMEIRALSGGGFVLAAYQGGTTFGFRTYSSVGVGGTYTSVSGWNTTSQIVITTFSDNTFAALYPSSNTALVVTRFNTTGGVVATYSGPTDWQSNSGYDFITLSTGIAVILSVDVDSGSNRLYGRTYDQSTGAISGRNLLAGSQQFQQTVNAFALSSGGFVATNGVPGAGQLELRRYNAAFGVLNAADISGLPAYCPSTQTGHGQRTTILEGATFLTMIDNGYVTTSYSYSSMPYVQIDKANLTNSGIRRRFPASQVITNISAPVSGYARSASTPNAASFLSSTTQTLSTTVARSSGTTFALAPFVAISDTTITSHCLTDMTNGQFVISHRSSSGSVRFTVFNPDGTQFGSFLVVASGANNLTRCTCLGNGKLVVSWVPNSNDRANFSVFAAGTYALLATGTTAGSLSSLQGPDSWNSSGGHDIGPFGNDSFVLGFANAAGGATVAVFNDSAVFQSNDNTSAYSGIQNVRIASDATGAVAIKFFSSSAGQGYVAYFTRNTTTNSIFIFAANTVNNYTGNNWGEGAAAAPCGTIFGFASNTSSRFIGRSTPNSNFTINFSSHSFNGAGVCIGQNGDFVIIRIDASSTAQWARYSVLGALGPYGTSVGQNSFDTDNITITGQNTNSGVGSQAQIVNLYNDIYAFSYINGGNSSGGQVVVGFISTAAATYSTTITAGVTPSATALVPSPANGYYLAGVSASECAAGGTGVLQVNGAATLNSQYPAGTTSQAFDFNTPALDVGIRGTIAGRNLILSGGK